MAPDVADFLNTLGAAYISSKAWQAAADSLHKANGLHGAVLYRSANAFFLAIAHWHLGHTTQARDWYDRAVISMEKYAPNDPTCRTLRAKAQKLIGTQSP